MSSQQKTIDCFCGSREASEIKEVPYTVPFFQEKFGKAIILKCKNCGLMRTSPTPILDIPDFYENNSVSESHRENLDLWVSFSKEIIDKTLPYKNKGRFLDIGCNIGVLVNEAKKVGFEAEGIDLNQEAIDYGVANLGANIRKEYLEKIPGESLYDVIAMNHVIEHIPNLKEFSQHIIRLLKPDGVFVAICPNAQSGAAKTLNLLNQRKGGMGSNWFWYGYLPEQHVWQFSPSTLKNVLSQCGFSQVTVSAKQNMHWGATENEGLRFKLMGALWKGFELLNMGDNLFSWSRVKK